MPHTHQKSSVARLSVISNSALVLAKLVVGVLIGSVSVISEAIHSGVDLLAAVIAWMAVRQSEKPADSDHPYGHGKFENVSGTVEALLIFLAAAWIIYEALHKITKPGPVEAPGIGVAVMGISALVNVWVSNKLFKVARATDSVALEADAWHLRTDVYTSVGVAGALLVIWLGAWFFPGVNLAWVDPVAAIAVALLIIQAAWELTVKSAKDLFDVALPEDEVLWIRARLPAISSAICGMHRLRTRKSGSQRFIDLHLILEPTLNIKEGHDISDRVIEVIHERFPGASVIVHVEPCDPQNCKPHCLEGCLKKPIARAGKK